MINNATHYFIFGLYLFISSEFVTTDTHSVNDLNVK